MITKVAEGYDSISDVNAAKVSAKDCARGIALLGVEIIPVLFGLIKRGIARYKGREIPSTRTELIPAEEIRFSQTSVNGAGEIIESMKKNGWLGDAIDVVEMPDGKLTTIDNTRLIAAQIVGIKAKVVIHKFNEKLPDKGTKDRFTTKKGCPETWGDAVKLRIGKQSSSYRKENPNGSRTLNKVNM